MKEFTTLMDMDWSWTYWVAGLFALLEFFKWIYSTRDFWLKTLGFKTKGMLQREEYETRLKAVETAIAEIKDTSKRNVDMFLEHEKQVIEMITDIKREIVFELSKLHEKIDEQKIESDEINKANQKTDRAMLRDRIASGMRYFSSNRDAEGRVHIKQSDYENMYALFEEYFAKDGNGPFKRMFEDEFKHFIIDR